MVEEHRQRGFAPTYRETSEHTGLPQKHQESATATLTIPGLLGGKQHLDPLASFPGVPPTALG